METVPHEKGVAIGCAVCELVDGPLSWESRSLEANVL